MPFSSSLFTSNNTEAENCFSSEVDSVFGRLPYPLSEVPTFCSYEVGSYRCCERVSMKLNKVFPRET